MRVCVVGAGAIGGLVAVQLARVGEEVTVVARGAHLAAIRERGLALRIAGEEHVVRVRATDRLRDAGPQDLVVLAVKAHQLGAVAPDVAAVAAPDVPVVTAQNGVPWWYFVGHGGRLEGTRLETVDPGGTIATHLDARRVLGSILYPAAELAAPGVVQHVEGNRISVGELDGADTPRVRRVADLLRAAGFKARVASDLRAELWVKLWGNCTFNPISALTHATLEDICRFPLTRALSASAMREAQEVAERLGVRFPLSLERRIAGAEAVGAHKTSTLQDVESGRPMEIDALAGAVVELGRLTGVATPHLDALYACASLLAQRLRDSGGHLKLD